MLCLMIVFNLLDLPPRLLLLTDCILNDHVLHFDLIGRPVDHVLNHKLPVTQLADAASLALIVACFLLCSE